MQILKTARFLDELAVIVDFIAKDSLSQAFIFLDKLDERVFSLKDTPYSCRQSTKSNDVSVRELIFNPNYALESPTILQRLSAWVFAKYLRFTRR